MRIVMSPKPPPIDKLQVRRLAAEAAVAEQTLVKRLRGEHVRTNAGARADQVLRAHGLEPGCWGFNAA